MSDIFISYARDERERVEPLVRLLESNGLSVWWDLEIQPGSTFERVIDEAILSASVVLVVWTRKSIQSEWVQAEASDGLERGILIPVMLDKVRVPVAFRGKESVNLFHWPNRKNNLELQRLLHSITAMLGKTHSVFQLPADRRDIAYFSRKYFPLTAITVLLMLAFIGFRLIPTQDAMSPGAMISPSTPIASISVLPFKNADKLVSAQGYEGLSYEIASLLRRAESLQISTEEQVDSYLSKMLLGMVSSLDTNYQLNGVIVFDENGVATLEVVLFDASKEQPLWNRYYGLSPDKIPDTARLIAEDVASEFKVSVPILRTDVDAGSYLTYLKAQAELRKPRSLQVLQTAKALFMEVVANEPRFTDAFAGLCRTDLALYQETQKIENFEVAEKHCHRANTLNSHDSSVYIALGELYRQSGNLQESRDNLRMALRLTPFSTSAMRELSKTMIQLNRFDDAEKQLESTLQIEPGYWLNYQEMGRIQFMQGNFAAAAEYYQVQSELDADNSRAMNNLGAAYYMSEQFEEAIAAWESTEKLQQNDRTLSNLGSAYFFKRQFDRAANMYSRAIEVAPENHQYWGSLAEALSQLPDGDSTSCFETALELAESRLAISPEDGLLLSAIAAYAAALGDEKKTDEILTRFQLAEPRDLNVVYNTAVATARLGREVDARKYLNQLITMGYSKTLLSLDANFDGINLQLSKEKDQ